MKKALPFYGRIQLQGVMVRGEVLVSPSERCEVDAERETEAPSTKGMVAAIGDSFLPLRAIS